MIHSKSAFNRKCYFFMMKIKKNDIKCENSPFTLLLLIISVIVSPSEVSAGPSIGFGRFKTNLKSTRDKSEIKITKNC